MNEHPHDHPAPGSSPAAHDLEQLPLPERRSFLAWAVHGLGVLFAAILGVPAVLYLIDPRNRPAPERGFKTVARLSELKENEPQQFVIRDIRHDAWTLHPNDVVGRVWVVKRGKDKVDVYTTVCPHLGCSVNYEAGVKRFICPCHNGTFDLNGHKVLTKNNPAPRAMDTLVWRRDPANPDLIQVKYENFKQGEAEKELKA
jgi:Rieske Fe-S protein